MMENKWPDDYPEELELPPEHAEEISARLFRLVNKIKIDADDFLASYKDPEQAHLIHKPKFKNKPSFYATSFFNTEESIRNLKSELPHRFGHKHIAVGNVKPEHGKGELSKRNSHVSIWFYDGIYPEGFSVI